MRHVLITAGTKGLGKMMTDYFLSQGYSVTATYRSDDKRAKQLQKDYQHISDRLQILQLDVTDHKQIKHIVHEVVERFGRIDCFVSNAGPYIFERKKLVDYEESEWKEMVNGNLDVSFYFLKEIIPMMRKQQFGRVVFLGFQGVNQTPGWIYRSAFAAAKVGTASLMKTIALEEAEHGITANMVAPGNITGEMKESRIAQSRDVNDSETPIGRPGTGEDIARTVGFLAQEDSDMITGSVIEVTGGLDVIHRHLTK